MAIIQSGADTTTLVVDPASRAARFILYDTSGNAITYRDNVNAAVVSGVVSMATNDGQVTAVRSDRLGSLASALHTPLMTDSFEGTSQNTTRWNISQATMTASQASASGLVMNNGATTAINSGYMIQSARRFLKTQRSPMQAKFRLRPGLVANSVQEWGFGDALTVNGAHTTGAYWQATASGVVQPVVTFNGVDVSAGAVDIRNLLDTTRYYTFDVIFDDDEAIFYCQDTSTGLMVSRQSLKLPLAAVRLFSTTQLQVMARLYTTGTAPVTAPVLIITDIYVAGLDALQNKPWADVLASMDRSGLANPLNGAQFAQWANNAEPASAVLSNTAAGYATLGGKFQFTAVAGAATDYALFALQLPLPINFTVTGVDIESWNTGAAVATTPTLMTWALAIGSNSVSLATGAPLSRVGLGAQDFPVGAGIGARATRISKQFRTGLNVSSGRFLHVILRMPIATATALQVIAGMVNIEGYTD